MSNAAVAALSTVEVRVDATKLSTGAIAGICVGAAACVALLALVGFLAYRRWAIRTGRLRPRGPPLPDPATGMTAPSAAFVFTDIQVECMRPAAPGGAED